MTAKTMRNLMVSVTQKGGTGFKAHIAGIQVAAKSGTVEKVDKNTGKYNKAKNRASFIGFAPAKSPKVAALVIIDEPQKIAYGGEVAGPAFRRIVEAVLVKYGVLSQRL